MRAVADEVGTTTRAIWSLFGSKDGLIAALGVRAFDVLDAAVNAVPVTDDPAADLVAAGVEGFTRLFIDHPALFRLGVQQIDVAPAQLVEIRVAAQHAWVAMQTRVERLQRDRQLASVAVQEAAKAFHALCEGLAALELRGFVRGKQRNTSGALPSLRSSRGSVRSPPEREIARLGPPPAPRSDGSAPIDQQRLSEPTSTVTSRNTDSTPMTAPTPFRTGNDRRTPVPRADPSPGAREPISTGRASSPRSNQSANPARPSVRCR